ncbi:MAG: site-2 protease family protein [Clostridiales bacterium]|nr:site-2 protease family protein [Clostridiales bacterium]
MDYLIIFLMGIPAIMVATTIHEFTRAAVSTHFGDKLPKEQGRLTLNPLKHFEPIGLIIMLACGFGWGQPVNTSSMYYKDRRKGVLITAIAPTVANLIFAFVFMFLASITNIYYLAVFFMKITYFCCCLVIYNLVPVAPMDCLKVLAVVLPANTYFKFMQYEKTIQMVFLLLLFLGLSSVFEQIISMLYVLIGAICF